MTPGQPGEVSVKLWLISSPSGPVMFRRCWKERTVGDQGLRWGWTALQRWQRWNADWALCSRFTVTWGFTSYVCLWGCGLKLWQLQVFGPAGSLWAFNDRRIRGLDKPVLHNARNSSPICLAGLQQGSGLMRQMFHHVRSGGESSCPSSDDNVKKQGWRGDKRKMTKVCKDGLACLWVASWSRKGQSSMLS